MANPERQAILQNPVRRQVLHDGFQDNPKAVHMAMLDPEVQGKTEKLLSSEIVQMA
jgi:hypothetical protein